ncbi:hypothetical protein Tco_1193507 [Tanacetum coccineum]
MNPTTVMVDEGKEHAKTEDPHEDVGKLEKDGDKAVVMIVMEGLLIGYVEQWPLHDNLRNVTRPNDLLRWCVFGSNVPSAVKVAILQHYKYSE